MTWLQENCTSDPDALQNAFHRLRPGEYARGRMLDAAAAIEHLSKLPNARRVLLLVSESRDRGSESDLAGVTVYAATYSALKTGFTSKTLVRQQPPEIPPPSIPNPNKTWNGAPPSKYNPLIAPPEDRLDLLAGVTELARLRKVDTTQVLSGGTGGRTLPFARQKGLEGALEKLGAELHDQYVLSFAPEASTPGYHILEVRLTRKGDFHIRARPGYWSSGDAQ